jgi:predicted NBD/HSP70 family sugar kinase
MHPSVVRQIHASRIFHTVRLNPYLSQREIAAKAGADKSTVSAIIRDFESMGLIERTRQSPDRPGRPGERIALSARSGLLIGVHPRPSEIRIVAAGLDGNPIGTLALPMTKAPEELAKQASLGIDRLIAQIGRERRDILGVGVSISGVVTLDGHLAQSPNLGWSDVPLRSLLRETIKLPLYVGNNSNSAAIAEQMFGHGAKSVDFLYVESGSGVGGGLILDGVLYRGAVGYAGEIGHMKVVPNGRMCRCGGRGCLSGYVADHAVLNHIRQMGMPVGSPAQILDLAAAGDLEILDVIAEAGGLLGLALANLVNLFNPPLIVIGGGLARFSPYMMGSVKRSLKANALPAVLSECAIEISSVSLEAIPRGGIALALEGCTSFHASDATPW